MLIEGGSSLMIEKEDYSYSQEVSVFLNLYIAS